MESITIFMTLFSIIAFGCIMYVVGYTMHYKPAYGTIIGIGYFIGVVIAILYDEKIDATSNEIVWITSAFILLAYTMVNLFMPFDMDSSKFQTILPLALIGAFAVIASVILFIPSTWSAEVKNSLPSLFTLMIGVGIIIVTSMGQTYFNRGDVGISIKGQLPSILHGGSIEGEGRYIARRMYMSITILGVALIAISVVTFIISLIFPAVSSSNILIGTASILSLGTIGSSAQKKRALTKYCASHSTDVMCRKFL